MNNDNFDKTIEDFAIDYNMSIAIMFDSWKRISKNNFKPLWKPVVYDFDDELEYESSESFEKYSDALNMGVQMFSEIIEKTKNSKDNNDKKKKIMN